MKREEIAEIWDKEMIEMESTVRRNSLQITFLATYIIQRLLDSLSPNSPHPPTLGYLYNNTLY